TDSVRRTPHPARATPSGTLTAATDAMGEATFGNLSIIAAGTYHLVATSGSISAQSSDFTISAQFSLSNVRITVFDGSGQSAAVNTAYSAPLKAIVQDLFGTPLANTSVTFAPPTSGASVTFSVSATVTTDAGGIATSPAMTANSQTGAFMVSASTPNGLASALFNLT